MWGRAIGLPRCDTSREGRDYLDHVNNTWFFVFVFLFVFVFVFVLVFVKCNAMTLFVYIYSLLDRILKLIYMGRLSS